MSDNNQRYLDAKRDVDHSYWSALLTLNGILITVFTAFSFFTDFKFVTSLIVVLSIWACWLMIRNFKISQNVFDKLGGLKFPIENIPDNPTEEQKEKILNDLREFEKNFNPKEATRLHKKITSNEKIVTVLFWLQMGIIIIFLLINLIKGQGTSF
ncbi:MAG: hypothetical protein IPJ03_20530 [Ignavibacteriales bacterium]|nr:hypothetical protein [Ignavibacteriales bacterium]